MDAGDIKLGEIARTLRVKPGKSAKLKLPVQLPANAPPLDYTVFARVDTSNSAIQDANPANDVIAAQAPLTVAASSVDLAARFVSLPNAPLEAFVGGDSDCVTVAVANEGNTTTSGSVAVDVYLSTDVAFDAGGDVLLGSATLRGRAGIEPGGEKNLKVTLAPPPAGTAAGTYSLIAIVDPAGAVAETDESNNVAASPTQVPVVASPPPPFDDHHHHHAHGYYWTDDGTYVDTYYYYDDGEWYYTDEVVEPPPPPPDDGYDSAPPDNGYSDDGMPWDDRPGTQPSQPPEDDNAWFPPDTQPDTQPAPEPPPADDGMDLWPEPGVDMTPHVPEPAPDSAPNDGGWGDESYFEWDYA
jgi:hypothetical protein